MADYRKQIVDELRKKPIYTADVPDYGQHPLIRDQERRGMPQAELRGYRPSVYDWAKDTFGRENVQRSIRNVVENPGKIIRHAPAYYAEGAVNAATNFYDGINYFLDPATAPHSTDTRADAMSARKAFDVAGMVGGGGIGATGVARAINKPIVPRGEMGSNASTAKALDMSDAARLQRARDMGYDTDTVYYRGRGNPTEPNTFYINRQGYGFDSQQTRSGIFGSASPEEASAYAAYHSLNRNLRQHENYKNLGFFRQLFSKKPDKHVEYENANVVPFYVRSGNQKIIDIDKIDFRKTSEEKELLRAKSEGYDTAILRNNYDFISTPADEIVVFDPSYIRSVNAAFDPAKKKSSNIMHSSGVPGLYVEDEE